MQAGVHVPVIKHLCACVLPVYLEQGARSSVLFAGCIGKCGEKDHVSWITLMTNATIDVSQCCPSNQF